MVGAEVKSCLDAYHGITCDKTLCDALAKTLFNCGEVVLGNCAADNFVRCEYEFFFACIGLETDPYVTELAVAAGLLLMTSLLLNSLADGFSVSNSGNCKVRTCS